MNRSIVLALAVAGFVALAGTAQALSVTPGTSASALANALVGAGVNVTSASLIGASGSAGTFTGGAASGVTIDQGIILATGLVAEAVGPNTSGDLTTAFETAGDGTLSALAGFPTYDYAALTVNFTTAASSLYFNFAFASDEYNEWVDSSYNDVFAFYLDGVNLGLVPGTTTPISVNTVNLGANSAYYINNVDGVYDLAYDGVTTPIQVAVSGLNVGSHTLVFGIADASDELWDSAVFIEAGTLGDVPVDPGSGTINPVPEPASILLLGSGMIGLLAAGRRKK